MEHFYHYLMFILTSALSTSAAVTSILSLRDHRFIDDLRDILSSDYVVFLLCFHTFCYAFLKRQTEGIK